MKTLIFLVLLLQTIFPQQDSLRKFYLDQATSQLNEPVQDIEKFFARFSGENSPTAAALQIDTSLNYLFDVVFSSPLDYNVSSKSINVDFNYLVEDKLCSNAKRNGILLKEIIQRTPPKKKEPEKLDKTVFVLIPIKCSSTRFYNAQGDMFCDNKRQFPMEYDEGTKTAGLLKVKVQMQLFSTSYVEVNKTIIPPDASYPIETHLTEYILRCGINSLSLMEGDKILDICVSLRK